MERSSKRSKIEPTIILNYGIEIEVVLELINKYNTYYYLIKSYESDASKTIETLIRFIIILRYNIEKYKDTVYLIDNKELDILLSNKIYTDLQSLLNDYIYDEINIDNINAELFEKIREYFEKSQKKRVSKMETQFVSIIFRNQEKKLRRSYCHTVIEDILLSLLYGMIGIFEKFRVLKLPDEMGVIALDHEGSKACNRKIEVRPLFG